MGGLYSDTKSVPILATRGCPYQCTYCSAPNMWTPKWVPRDLKKVVDEIQFYMETMGARNFPFQDLTAIIKREWIVDFCNELLARAWRSPGRCPPARGRRPSTPRWPSSSRRPT